MRGLTIWQPWASQIAAGAKRFETRSWATQYRGWLAIHAGLAPGGPEHVDLPRGCIVAVARLVACLPAAAVRDQITDAEWALGDYRDGRWAWQLADVRPLDPPVPCRGAQMLWTVPETIARQIESSARLRLAIQILADGRTYQGSPREILAQMQALAGREADSLAAYMASLAAIVLAGSQLPADEHELAERLVEAMFTSGRAVYVLPTFQV